MQSSSPCKSRWGICRALAQLPHLRLLRLSCLHARGSSPKMPAAQAGSAIGSQSGRSWPKAHSQSKRLRFLCLCMSTKLSLVLRRNKTDSPHVGEHTCHHLEGSFKEHLLLATGENSKPQVLLAATRKIRTPKRARLLAAPGPPSPSPPNWWPGDAMQTHSHTDTRTH